MKSRPRPAIMSITEAAAERVKEIMDGAEESFNGVRIGVKNGGCAGMAYTMDYVNDKEPLDEVVTDKGVTIFVDAKAVLFLLGTQMDYEEDILSSGFTFHNPNQVGACGCGESVQLEPADMKLLEV